MNPLEQLMMAKPKPDAAPAMPGAPAVAPQPPVGGPPPAAPGTPPPAPGGNPLAALAPAMAPQQQPAPTHAQTVAAMHRFTSIRGAMKEVMEDPAFGKSNVRPKLLNAASKLLGDKVLPLSDIMNAIKDMPEDPMAQKAFVKKIFDDAGMAQQSALEHYRNAPMEEGVEDYDHAKYSDHMTGLMGHYTRK